MNTCSEEPVWCECLKSHIRKLWIQLPDCMTVGLNHTSLKLCHASNLGLGWITRSLDKEARKAGGFSIGKPSESLCPRQWWECHSNSATTRQPQVQSETMRRDWPFVVATWFYLQSYIKTTEHLFYIISSVLQLSWIYDIIYIYIYFFLNINCSSLRDASVRPVHHNAKQTQDFRRKLQINQWKSVLQQWKAEYNCYGFESGSSKYP